MALNWRYRWIEKMWASDTNEAKPCAQPAGKTYLYVLSMIQKRHAPGTTRTIPCAVPKYPPSEEPHFRSIPTRCKFGPAWIVLQMNWFWIKRALAHLCQVHV